MKRLVFVPGKGAIACPAFQPRTSSVDDCERLLGCVFGGVGVDEDIVEAHTEIVSVDHNSWFFADPGFDDLL